VPQAGRDAGMPDSAVDAGSPIDAGGAEPDAERDGWTLSFRDEFNEPEGEGVDTTKWTPVNKGDGFGNNELEFYTPRTQNARMDGQGSLIIEVLKEDYMGRMYTSTRLESSGKFEQRYGRFEIRAKVPFGQGIWPAYWLLGNDIASASWPNCGEIDIMEQVGRMPSTNYGSLHGPGYSGGNPLSTQYHLEGGARFADTFHEYAIEWEPDVVRFYVDDELYSTRTPSDVPSGGRWVYDHPFFMILNVAVGGPFPGSPDGTTMFPQRMLVDYVRVYRRP
jgi:beta-glucanase (GH16 family)